MTRQRHRHVLPDPAVGRHLIDERRRRGAIVNIASTHALVGAPERSTYGIVKAALVQMTRMLAIEWAEHGIRVNAIAPGRMETASPSRAGNGVDPAYMKAMLDRIPLHRLCTRGGSRGGGVLSSPARWRHRSPGRCWCSTAD